MARQGENIRRRKDGRWEGRYPIYSSEKSKIVYRSVYGHSYKEVKEKKQKESVKNACPLTKTNIFLCDAALEWLSVVKEQKKQSTYIKYSRIYHKHIEMIFDGAIISDITSCLIQEHLSDNLSDSMYRSIYCVINQILRFAAEKTCTTAPVLKNTKQANNQRRPLCTLSVSEQSQLLGTLHHATNTYKLMVLMCLHTGLRLGELCGLKWEDINIESRTLTVRRTVQRLYVQNFKSKTILMETEPKSARSKREIPLSLEAAALLLRFSNNGAYVFGGNKPLEPRKMQYHFKKILKAANLSDKNFHVLRHTFATNCIEGGMDVKSLSEILGHSNVQITMNRYVHPSMDTKRRYIEALSVFYGQIYGQAG